MNQPNEQNAAERVASEIRGLSCEIPPEHATTIEGSLAYLRVFREGLNAASIVAEQALTAAVEAERDGLRGHLNYLESIGLTVGPAKAKGHLVYLVEPGTELDDSAHLERIAGLKIENKTLRTELTALRAAAEGAKAIIKPFLNEIGGLKGKFHRSEESNERGEALLKVYDQLTADLTPKSKGN